MQTKKRFPREYEILIHIKHLISLLNFKDNIKNMLQYILNNR